MAVVHIYTTEAGFKLKEVTARTMKGLPRNVEDVTSWWKACRRTFKGSRFAWVFEGEPHTMRISGEDIRFALGLDLVVIVDRKREILTS